MYSSSSSSYGRTSRFDNLTTILIVAFLAFVVVVLGVMTYNAAAVSGSADGCTVTNKTETKGYKGHIHRRILAEGCNGSTEVKTFEVTDNWFAGQFDTAGKTYSGIEIGKTYDFETRGSRIEWLESFENVVAYTAK